MSKDDQWPWYLRAYVSLIIGGGVVANLYGLYLIATDQTPY